MTTVATFNRVGEREDLSNIISRIDPTATPFQSLIGSERRHNRLYEWQEDTLRDVRQNAFIEASDAVAEERAATLRRANTTQILRIAFNVSDGLDPSKLAGRQSEKALQTLKTSQELKRELEHSHVGQSQDAALGSDTVPGLFGNIFGSDATVGGALQNCSLRVDGGGLGLTENMVINGQLAARREGARPSVLMVTLEDSLSVANFVGVNNRERDIGNTKEIVNVIEIYQSPYGRLKVVQNEFLQQFIPAGGAATGEQDPDNDGDATTNPTVAQAGAALLLDPTSLCSVVRRPFERTELAKTGDATKYMMQGEYGFCTKNRRSNVVIENLGAPGTT